MAKLQKKRQKNLSIRLKDVFLQPQLAPVAELVDALDLGSSNLGCAGSSPVRRTIILSILRENGRLLRGKSIDVIRRASHDGFSPHHY